MQFAHFLRQTKTVIGANKRKNDPYRYSRYPASVNWRMLFSQGHLPAWPGCDRQIRRDMNSGAAAGAGSACAA